MNLKNFEMLLYGVIVLQPWTHLIKYLNCFFTLYCVLDIFRRVDTPPKQ